MWPLPQKLQGGMWIWRSPPPLQKENWTQLSRPSLISAGCTPRIRIPIFQENGNCLWIPCSVCCWSSVEKACKTNSHLISLRRKDRTWMFRQSLHSLSNDTNFSGRVAMRCFGPSRIPFSIWKRLTDIACLWRVYRLNSKEWGRIWILCENPWGPQII